MSVANRSSGTEGDARPDGNEVDTASAAMAERPKKRRRAAEGADRLAINAAVGDEERPAPPTDIAATAAAVLPNELIEHVLNRLPLACLPACRLASRDLRALTDGLRTWEAALRMDMSAEEWLHYGPLLSSEVTASASVTYTKGAGVSAAPARCTRFSAYTIARSLRVPFSARNGVLTIAHGLMSPSEPFPVRWWELVFVLPSDLPIAALHPWVDVHSAALPSLPINKQERCLSCWMASGIHRVTAIYLLGHASVAAIMRSAFVREDERVVAITRSIRLHESGDARAPGSRADADR